MLTGPNHEQLVQLVLSNADPADRFDLVVSQAQTPEIG
jgi:hypothetical protein